MKRKLIKPLLFFLAAMVLILSVAALMFWYYPSVPSCSETDGPDASAWFTHFPNDPRVKGPDRTIDYLFSPPLA